jgi:hypothetical protein
MSLFEATYVNHILASSPIPRVPGPAVVASPSKPVGSPAPAAAPKAAAPKAANPPWIAEVKKRAEKIEDELAALKAKRLAAQNAAAPAAEARAREARREELDRAFQTGAHAQDARRTTGFDGITQTFGVGVAR